MAGRLRPVPEVPPRAAVYVRQSVERDGSISPAVQEQSCRDYAARVGYTVATVVADVGVSGLRWGKRPGIQHVMAMVAAHQVDVVLVWRWSRLSRSRLHQAVALDAIEKAGGRVESATEPFDQTTAGGRFGRDVMLAAAAFESQQKAEQWRDAHQRRRDRGLPASGGERIGYRVDGDRYVPDPDTAPIVAQAFARYIAGAGVLQLAEWLADMGVVSHKSGRAFTRRGLWYSMETGFAAGYLHTMAGEYLQAGHEPIITAKVWEAFLAERARRKTSAPRLLHAATRLAGVVRCGHCGNAMTRKVHPDTADTMRCTAPACTSRAWARRDRVEAAVREWLPLVADLVEQTRISQPVEAVQRIDRRTLSRRIDDVAGALRRLVLELGRDLITEVEFREARDELRRERERLEGELEALDVASKQTAGAVEAARTLLEMWDDGDPADINRIARDLVRVTVSRAGAREALNTITVRAAWE